MNEGLRKRVFLVAFYLCLIFVFFAASPHAVQRLVYPFYYREMIVQEAEKHEQDPRLIAAIIWVESRFKDHALSSKGAMGLMQIMPTTGFWAAEMVRLELQEAEELLEPRVNIALGTWYFHNLLQVFDGNIYAALAAYNGGQGHVARWLKAGTWDGSLENVEAIPFPETRQFVIKVANTYDRYKMLYSCLAE